MSTKPQRIALLLPDLDVGGAQRTMLTLAREMRADGLRVDIVSLTGGGALVGECPSDVAMFALNPVGVAGAGLFLRSLESLLRYLREARPDAVLSTITGCNLLACMAHRLGGCKFRLVLREAVSLRNASKLRRRAIGWLYPWADAVVALSESLAAELRQMGLRSVDVHVIPNPVDVQNLRALAEQSLPKSLRERRFVACVGRLVEQKDHATALRAFSVSKSASDHLLAMVGDGPLRDDLHALSDELGMADKVVWLGELRNPYPVILHADAMLLTSRWEGSPNVLLEAIALGTPIVATDGPGGVRDILTGLKKHHLVEAGSVCKIAEGLSAVLGAKERPAPFVSVDRRPAAVARRYMELLLKGSIS